jgi:hypothetical protein
MWAILAKLISGPIISGAIEAYKAKLAAGSNQDKLAADLAGKDLELQAREREINVQQNIADGGRWWTAAPRAIVCWAMAIFIAKVVMWDTVLGWGATPALKGLVADAFQAVIVMWFGGRTIEKVARIWRSR